MTQFEQDLQGRVSTARVKTRPLAWNATLASWLILAGALAGGIFLRVWQINALGYNTDEAVYAGQAAGIAQVPVLKDLFPVFRAHPLLFQFLLSLLFKNGFNDLYGRLLAAGIGMGTILLVYLVGKTLYGNLPGSLAALFIAFMPYHVVVSRQVLLDGPMAFFATLTLFMLAKYAVTERRIWLYATGAAMGLTVLSKETGIVMLGAIYVFLALARGMRIHILDVLIATLIMIAVIAPFPISMILAGGGNTGKQYLIWQLFRRANHEWTFYPTTVTPAIGMLVVLAAVLGIIFLWKERSRAEGLLISWILVPVAFFQLWPTKGFQYLLPVAPAFALLASRFTVRWQPRPLLEWMRRKLSVNWLSPVMGGVVAFSLFFTSWSTIQPAQSNSFLAGTGGVPGGREAGLWVAKNVPSGAEMVAIGPSMANIIEFYGHRKVFGLSVSPNPLYRNPSYQPVPNLDLSIRNADIQYIIWDSFSAARSAFFSNNLMKYVQKYNGRVVHVESILTTDANGKQVAQPVIIIYEVRP
ncbi:MAG: glycosyltransferase family 39 protein [Chloroflexi bacterium]|nr:glycosyltransferase family 39 protein [Chloroflexota bacterium]